MDLKEILEIVFSTNISEEILCYLETKKYYHRKLLLDTFPDFNCFPKHYYIEHYVHFTRCFGPLVDLWTMQYDSKHNFYKRVVHDVVNFTNIVIMLSTQHQQMMAFYFDGKSLLKPKLYTASVDKVHIASLEEKLSKAIQN